MGCHSTKDCRDIFFFSNLTVHETKHTTSYKMAQLTIPQILGIKDRISDADGNSSASEEGDVSVTAQGPVDDISEYDDDEVDEPLREQKLQCRHAKALDDESTALQQGRVLEGKVQIGLETAGRLRGERRELQRRVQDLSVDLLQEKHKSGKESKDHAQTKHDLKAASERFEAEKAEAAYKTRLDRSSLEQENERLEGMVRYELSRSNAMVERLAEREAALEKSETLVLGLQQEVGRLKIKSADLEQTASKLGEVQEDLDSAQEAVGGLPDKDSRPRRSSGYQA